MLQFLSSFFSAFFLYKRKTKKKALEHFKHVFKIWSQFRRLVCRTKDKIKIKIYEEKVISASVCLATHGHAVIHTVTGSFQYGIMFTVNQKWKNKIYKLGKLDDGNPIQQITRSSDKRQKETKKHAIKPDSKLD